MEICDSKSWENWLHDGHLACPASTTFLNTKSCFIRPCQSRIVLAGKFSYSEKGEGGGRMSAGRDIIERRCHIKERPISV